MSNLSHTNESDYAELDAMMGFDPSNTQIFNASDGSVEPLDIYRTSPKDSKTEDGHYHSKVRLLYNVHNRNRTIVHSAIYNLRDEEGYFSVQSLLGEKDPYSPYFKEYKSCPVFRAWKKLHFSEDPKVKERGDEYFKKFESSLYDTKSWGRKMMKSTYRSMSEDLKSYERHSFKSIFSYGKKCINR